MSRRSQSPEGVGDLLKQDSFGGFEEDDPLNDAQDTDMPMNGGESTYDGGSKEGNEGNSQNGDPGGQGESMVTESASNPGAVRPNITRIPVPSFKGVSNVTGGGGAAAQRTSGGRGPARYFIIKSNNAGNIDQSIKNGIWATQKHNEDKFFEAYKTASHVYLIFSINMSGHFQGYAKISGLPFRHQPGTWEGTSSVNNSFSVEWIRRYDLPFRETESLTNPLNENKPIKISRDGQELPLALGLKVCRMFDEGADADGVPKPPAPVWNPAMRAGPAVTGFGGGRGMGRGRGERAPPQGGPGNLVPTPMGMVPAHVAMQMGMSNPMAMQGMFPGMDGMNPMMMNMNMDPMAQMGMNPMMAARMQMMAGQQGMGMNGMPGPGRGPVPPPKPPPRSPPSRPAESELMQMMMKLQSQRMSGGPRSEEDLLLRAFELSRGRSPSRRDRRYRSRSRSASPRRGRSRRRSRSRSRSRSKGRGRDRDSDLTYEDYLEAFKAMNRKKELSDSRGVSGVHPMMSQMQGMMGEGGRGGAASMMGGSNMMKGMGGGVSNMSEDEYVRVWENYSKMSGQPFDAQTVRGWYRQHKQYTAGGAR